VTAQEAYDQRLAAILHRYEERVIQAKRDFDQELRYAKEALKKEGADEAP
jgi:hypothetical protein